MADGHHTPGHVRCITCWAREQAVPPEGQLRILVREDWLAETAAFVPRVMTREQGVAAELLTMALDRFVDAYGVDVAAPRIASILMVLRLQAKRQKVMARILTARAEINQRARQAWQRGGEAAARAIEAEPTPDYPGKARDDAWLKDDQLSADEAMRMREAQG